MKLEYRSESGSSVGGQAVSSGPAPSCLLQPHRGPSAGGGGRAEAMSTMTYFLESSGKTPTNVPFRKNWLCYLL